MGGGGDVCGRCSWDEVCLGVLRWGGRLLWEVAAVAAPLWGTLPQMCALKSSLSLSSCMHTHHVSLLCPVDVLLPSRPCRKPPAASLRGSVCPPLRASSPTRPAAWTCAATTALCGTSHPSQCQRSRYAVLCCVLCGRDMFCVVLHKQSRSADGCVGGLCTAGCCQLCC